LTRVLLTQRFEKNFKKLDGKTQGRVKDAVLSLKDEPDRGKSLTGDLAGEYSLRVGTYRILYIIQGDDVVVETVRHRRDVYKRK
jgi:mRNA interferase RelE/StbE